MPSINYSAIADRAVEIIGIADPAQYQVAYDVMVAETDTIPVSRELRITEGEILSGMGLSNGAAFIDKLVASIHASALRLLQAKGINVIDAESKAVMTNLLNGGTINQDEYDWVASYYSETIARWPGLKPGHVQNALEKRIGGQI